MTPLYLGIDGGASTCRARLADASGATLSEATAGPANVRTDLPAAWEEIMAATRTCLAKAGYTDADAGLIHAGLGLAGLGQSEDRSRLEAMDHPFARRLLATDAEIACLGAHANGIGGIVILGTGSCAQAHRDGHWLRVGGWGFPASDQASGAWLGLMAVRMGLEGHDGLRNHGTLTRAVLERFGNDPEQIVVFTGTARARDYATLAPLVFAAADQRDPDALALAQEAAADLGRMIARLQEWGVDAVSVMGGLAESVCRHLPSSVRQQLRPPLGDALDGALKLARGTVSPL